MNRLSLLSAARYAATTVLVLLAFLLLLDFGAISFGGFAADIYYQPLQSIPLDPVERRAVEDSLIDTHGRTERYRHIPYLIIHGVALAGIAVACAEIWRRRDPEEPAGSQSSGATRSAPDD